MQLLQTVAIDVTTRGSLGKCLAVRVGEVLTTMKSVGVEVSLTRAAVEKALLNTHQGRKSQQKFLHSTSCDTTVKHPCKGIGGNTQITAVQLYNRTEWTKILSSQLDKV